ncbi:hypothetical protein Hanom_Chr06g00551991 [Helianthus anomalus]
MKSRFPAGPVRFSKHWLALLVAFYTSAVCFEHEAFLSMPRVPGTGIRFTYIPPYQ